MAVSRRRALVLGAASGLVATVANPGTASAAPLSAGFTPAPDLGVSSANSAATNRANLVAVLSNSAVCVLFPPGDYQIDNSGSDIVISNYAGELVMQPGARLVFTDNTKRGLNFTGGTGARLFGLTTAFASPPTTRQTAQECVTILYTQDTYVEDVRIDGSAAAGLLFWQCVRPTVVGALITNTMADGLNFTNCQDGRADRVTTVDTGDDGVAFGNIVTGPEYTGGLATNLSVTRSRSRGVAVVGQSGVTVRDVTVDTTVGHGLYCAYEANWNTRVPTEVRFENGRVYRGGTANENSGVRVNNSGTVTVAGVTVEEPGAHGVFLSASTVTLSDVSVRDSLNTPGSGFNLQRGVYVADRLVAANTNGIGLYASDCTRLEYGTVTLQNTARTHSTRRAVSVQNTAYVFGERLWIYDSQTTATGYTVYAYGTQRGSLGTIIDQVNGRDIVVDNPSGLPYSRL
jgi:hypothetical protein